MLNIFKEIHEPFKVTSTAVDKHRNEEHGVEVWNGGCEADDRPPGEAHGPVGNVVRQINTLTLTRKRRQKDATYRFARIRPPATGQETVTIS